MAAVAQRGRLAGDPAAANYHHFVMDIVWYGIALAATTRFIQFYAIEMGATPMELGWLASLPSLMLMVFTTFSLWWRTRYSSTIASILLPGIGQRLIFLLPAFAPMFPEAWRPWWIVLAVTLPAVPQGIASTLFMVMMRETIPADRLAALFTRRMLAMNIAITAGALGFGVLLEALPFPQNYQVMFVICFLFAMLSMWHLTRVQALPGAPAARPVTKTGQPWWALFKNPAFVLVAVVTFLTHMAYTFIAAPQPLHLKNDLGATEGFIALFGTAEVLGGALVTLWVNQWAQRYGNRAITCWSMVVTALALVINALAPALWVTLIGAALAGAAWTVTVIGVLGYFTDYIDASDYQATTLWHQMIFFAMFVGPLVGSTLAEAGHAPVALLLVGAALRLAAGLLVLLVDRQRRPAPATPAA
ncbi:MAG: MFS transporter [Anaerolineae bacterium]|nr:MFS transporter [Anaerolineae bacterium]